MPSTAKPSRSKNSTASDPISPAEPVTRTFIGGSDGVPARSAMLPATMRVALTLEQCWHEVPGGTATSINALAGALAERDDVEVVGVAAHHRRPAPEPWTPPI